ncbi:Uncharacterised protein [Mycobacterium tuberculosis]|nr:Uncharacterised protein [Mycobacterium tuberculosis]
MVVVDDDAAAGAHAKPGGEGSQLAGVFNGDEVCGGEFSTQTVGGVGEVADGGAAEDEHAAFFRGDSRVSGVSLGCLDRF